MRHADNSYRWFEVEAASVAGEDSANLRCVGLVRDVTDARRAHDRLVRDAVKCSLTGLPHRELLMDRLGVAMQRAKIETSVRPTLITLGIDKFKGVNAQYGAVVGDSLMLTVARRLQRHIGVQDTLARLGGDQFGILLLTEQTSQNIAALAERIRRSLRSPITMGGREIVLTGSLGIAVYDGNEAGPADLLRSAESALYLAKRGGTDRVEVFKPGMQAGPDDQAMIVGELRKAIERNQIRVFYQPIVYLPTEELAGFEALIRWEHPKLGLIDPVSFEPIADDKAILSALSTQVLTRAVRDAALWQKEFPRPEMPLFVSVSMVRNQILTEEIATEIRQLLARSVIAKNTLRLEISESLIMENPEQAGDALEQLQGTGAELALDEFGAGYSSLPYLHKFPFATLKIDRTLVQGNLTSDSSGAAIVRSLVTLTHGLGKTAWADGVETADGASFLRGLGCEFGQGFYFGGLILDRDVIQLLKAIRKSESKLQPRGLFRSRSKSKKSDNSADIPAAKPAMVPAKQAPAHSSAQPNRAAASAAGSPPLPPGGAIKSNGSGQPMPYPHATGNGHSSPPNTQPAVQAVVMSPPSIPVPQHAAMPPPHMFATERPPEELMQLGPNPLTELPSNPPPLPPSAFIESVPAPSAPGWIPMPVDPMPVENGMMPPPPPFQVAGPQNGHRPPVQPNGRPPLSIVRPQRTPTKPAPDLSRLPPGVADSLARLAGNRTAARPSPVRFTKPDSE